MDKNYVEAKAINYLNTKFTSKNIFTNLNKDDKIPSFDGCFFYKPQSPSKKGMRIIPVQAKGTTDIKQAEKYPVDVDDLENYLSTGILFLVVYFEIENDELVKPVLFYNVVMPYDVIGFLARRNKTTYTIKMKRAEETTPFNICMEYIKKIDDVLSLTQYDEKTCGPIIKIEYKDCSGVFDELLSYSKYSILTNDRGQKFYGIICGEQTIKISRFSIIASVKGIDQEIASGENATITQKDIFYQLSNGIRVYIDENFNILKLVFDSSVGENTEWYKLFNKNRDYLGISFNGNKYGFQPDVQSELI